MQSEGGRGIFNRRREDNGTTEAEIEVMQPQAKEGWQPPKTGRSKE